MFKWTVNDLRQIHSAVSKLGRTMMYWGDIVRDFDGLLVNSIRHLKQTLYIDSEIAALPADAIVMEWGYEDSHDFDKYSARLKQHGLPFFVCPGTSSWNSIVCRGSCSTTT